MGPFRSAQSCARDARTAVQELYAGVAQEDPALVLFFCSCAYDLEALSEEINRCFEGIPVLGCTSAGSFGPQAYGQHALSGVSFARSAVTVATGFVQGLQGFDSVQAQALVAPLLQSLEREAPQANPANCFAFEVIDGMSGREEVFIRELQGALGQIPLVGGSAGDDMKFRRTWVFGNGAFHDDAAALVLIHTQLPFHLFMTQHFVPMEERLVVTEADAQRRIVTELNGLPAAVEYARCIGVDPAALDSTLFADWPVVVSIGDRHYVRSIQRVLPDAGLLFYCAIEEGVVLRVARGEDLLANLRALFAQIHERVGPPGLVLGCDCVLRRLEVQRHGLAEPVQSLLAENRAIGFCTYGEQFRGVHINQTLTGVAIGGGVDG